VHCFLLIFKFLATSSAKPIGPRGDVSQSNTSKALCCLQRPLVLSTPRDDTPPQARRPVVMVVSMKTTTAWLWLCVAIVAVSTSLTTAAAASASSSVAGGADGGGGDASANEAARRLPGGGLHADPSIACSGCAATVRQVRELLDHPSRDILQRTTREYDAAAVGDVETKS
jgi:hypothetical protein